MKLLLILIAMSFLFTSCKQPQSKVEPFPTATAEPIAEVGSPLVAPSITNISESYEKAIKYMEHNKFPQAIWILDQLSSYQSANKIANQLRYRINHSYLVGNNSIIAGITTENKVVTISLPAEKKDSLQRTVPEFENVIHLSTHNQYIDGLTKEGRFLTTDPTKSNEEINALTNLQSFYCNYPTYCYGITNKSRITIVSTTLDDIDTRLLEENRNDIVQIVGSETTVIALKKDGTLLPSYRFPRETRKELSSWEDIVSIQMGLDIFGLKSNGTVASLTNLTKDWHNIISIAASSQTILGLKEDGTVVALGDNSKNQCDTSNWTDIIAIHATDEYSLGLKKDGTLLSTKPEIAPILTGLKNLCIPTIY